MVNINKLKIFDVITTMGEYLLLKQRINVGRSICEYKKYKKCQLKYDRQLNNFSRFVYFTSLKIVIKKIDVYIYLINYTCVF